MVQRLLNLFLLLNLLVFPVFATDYTQVASCLFAYLLEEASGEAQDASSNNNDGTNATDITYEQTGKFDYGWSFDGAAAYFRFAAGAYTSANVGSTGITFTIYIKTSTNAADNVGIIGGGVDNNNNEYALGGLKLNSSEVPYFVGYDGAYRKQTGTTNVTSGGNYVHIAGGVDTGFITFLYVDGVSEGTPYDMASYGWGTADEECIGMNSKVSDREWYTGDMDEVACFLDNLDSTEINDIMDNGLDGTQGAPAARRIFTVF